MPGESVVLYKTSASVTSGGRDHGIARSDDGRLEVRLEMPKELGGSGEDGTNPEQLFAAGWAGCFMSALKTVAPVPGWQKRGLHPPNPASSFPAAIWIHQAG